MDPLQRHAAAAARALPFAHGPTGIQVPVVYFKTDMNINTRRRQRATCRWSISGSHAGAPSLPYQLSEGLLQDLDSAILIHELIHAKESDPGFGDGRDQISALSVMVRGLRFVCLGSRVYGLDV